MFLLQLMMKKIDHFLNPQIFILLSFHSFIHVNDSKPFLVFTRNQAFSTEEKPCECYFFFRYGNELSTNLSSLFLPFSSFILLFAHKHTIISTIRSCVFRVNVSPATLFLSLFRSTVL